MKKTAFIVLAALIAGAAAGALRYYTRSMDAAEAVRRLAGMRVAVTLYKIANKSAAPADFNAVIAGGQLEAPPELKLKWHRTSSRVRQTSALRAEDTGGWGYVNDPGSRDFGTVFIDCLHRDERGRYWSEF